MPHRDEGNGMATRQAVSVGTLKAISDAFNAHDLEAIIACEGLATRFEGLPDVHYSDDRRWVSGNLGVSEWLLTGTMPGGVRIRVRGCDHWEFRDGKVIRKDSYWKIVDTSG